MRAQGRMRLPLAVRCGVGVVLLLLGVMLYRAYSAAAPVAARAAAAAPASVAGLPLTARTRVYSAAAVAPADPAGGGGAAPSFTVPALLLRGSSREATLRPTASAAPAAVPPSAIAVAAALPPSVAAAVPTVVVAAMPAALAPVPVPVPVVAPTAPVVAFAFASSVQLVSRDAPAVASTRGNLGGPEQVTNDRDADWLKDRWQIARDMTGQSLPLPQWIRLHIAAPPAHPLRVITRVRLDWETAYARHYVLQTALSLPPPDSADAAAADSPTPSQYWTTVFEERNGSGVSQRHQHIVHDIDLTRTPEQRAAASIARAAAGIGSGPGRPDEGFPARYVRLVIVANGAPWGASLWRFEVYGR